MAADPKTALLIDRDVTGMLLDWVGHRHLTSIELVQFRIECARPNQCHSLQPCTN